MKGTNVLLGLVLVLACPAEATRRRRACLAEAASEGRSLDPVHGPNT